jgi:hypothetical protein
MLLECIVYFQDLWDSFQEIDADGDQRLSLQEFEVGWREYS